MTRSSQGDAENADPSCGRRNFLKQSVVSIGVTVHEYVKHQGAEKKPAAQEQPIRTDWLRPPGALAEDRFLEQCTSCGECVEACPHGSIRVLEGSETPIIFPDEKPCYLCDDFPCITSCEPEALRPVAVGKDVNMGVAVVAHGLCTSGQGCNACVAQCPTRAIVMDFSSMSICVDEALCVGCGICEHTCHTVNDRIAITVSPARTRVAP